MKKKNTNYSNEYKYNTVMTKWDKITSVEDDLREKRKERRKFWLWYAGMGLLAALSATSYWWIWILLGLFIQSR